LARSQQKGENMKLKVKAIRVNMNLTQKELADILQMPLSTYQKKENGISPWLYKEIVEIGKIANVDISEIEA
jgi:transcriptional regulator with XRE-family HTH domain